MNSAANQLRPLRPAGGHIEAAVAFIGVAVLAGGAGAAIGWLHPSTRSALVAAIGFAAALPLVYRWAAGTFDIFEPIVIANVAFLVMYVARPAVIVADGRPTVFKGIDVSSELNQALWLALIGVAAFQVGYMLPWAKWFALRTRLREGAWLPDVTTLYALGLLVLAALLFGSFIHGAGGIGFLRDMLKGRSDNQDPVFRHSSAYLYAAPQLVLPASLLLFAAGLSMKNRLLMWIAVFSMIPVVVFSGAQGSRITLLPLLFAPIVYWMLARDRRPSWLALTICSYILLTVGVAYLRDTRQEQHSHGRIAELGRSLADPTAEIRALVGRGIDNDMFESLGAELTVVGSAIPISPPNFAERLVAKPIPSVLWHSKPLDPDEHLNDVLFPNEPTRASSSTGILGSFYLAGGATGVFFGMALIGLLCRVVWEYFLRYRGVSVAQMLAAAIVCSIPMLLRGGISDTIARYLFMILPLVLAARLCWTTTRLEATEGRLDSSSVSKDGMT